MRSWYLSHFPVLTLPQIWHCITVTFCQLKFPIFASPRVWGDLSDIEKDMDTRRALDLICLDCGEVGAERFKHTHRCQDVGYRPMEAVNFLKECDTCHLYFVSVARLVLYSFLHHLRLPSLMCFCGKSFYNKGVFNLHVEWCHCGYHNLFIQTERKFGPPRT